MAWRVGRFFPDIFYPFLVREIFVNLDLMLRDIVVWLEYSPVVFPLRTFVGCFIVIFVNN